MKLWTVCWPFCVAVHALCQGLQEEKSGSLHFWNISASCLAGMLFFRVCFHYREHSMYMVPRQKAESKSMRSLTNRLEGRQVECADVVKHYRRLMLWSLHEMCHCSVFCITYHIM